jgi:hypothetical protein
MTVLPSPTDGTVNVPAVAAAVVKALGVKVLVITEEALPASSITRKLKVVVTVGNDPGMVEPKPASLNHVLPVLSQVVPPLMLYCTCSQVVRAPVGDTT